MKKGIMNIGMSYILALALGIIILVIVMINFGAPVLIKMLNDTLSSTSTPFG
jgi:hypothetical protein